MSSVHPSALVLDKHYDGVSSTGRKYLGQFKGCRLIGRPYDPDAELSFQLAGQPIYSFVWDMRQQFFEVPGPSAPSATSGVATAPHASQSTG